MCVHTRRTDFDYFNVTTEYGETIEAARILAKQSVRVSLMNKVGQFNCNCKQIHFG